MTGLRGSLRVTVVMPVHNRERHLRQALESLLAQRLAGIEMIAVGDGSTDAVPDIRLFRASRHRAQARLAFGRRRWGRGATAIAPALFNDPGWLMSIVGLRSQARTAEEASRYLGELYRQAKVQYKRTGRP